uniref:Uncharacterized protein n=1 Tax=Ditylenchus dipsaci TaxID=166011 RepID=A0A915EK68_9BILA
MASRNFFLSELLIVRHERKFSLQALAPYCAWSPSFFYSSFFIGLGTLLYLPSIIETSIRQSSILAKDSQLLEKWTNPEYMISTNMWTFSVRNPDDVLNNSVPEVKMMGPYVFDQKMRRKVHSLENGTVKYESYRSYYFNEENSCVECFLHNRIWIPNLIFQKFVEAASKPTMRAATAALLVCAIPFVNFVCETVLNLPERIGLFYDKNDTTTGVFEIMDGSSDGGNSLGKIVSFNGEKQMPEHWWTTPQATAIDDATDGTLFKPFINKSENLTVFVPELCKSLTLVFQKDVDYAGIAAYRYVVTQDDFDFSLDRNKGYCHPSKKFMKSKMRARGEPPIIVSWPNFLFAPDFVRNSIKGIRDANQERDQIELDLEPRLGAILQARRRFQINISMWKGVNLTMPGLDLSNFRNSIVPVLQIDEYSRIDAESLELIKDKLINAELAARVSCFGAMITSLLAVVVVAIYVVNRDAY